MKRAFQLLLAGNTNYESIGRELNLPRSTVRFILMNPIYTGHKIYSERRDPLREAYVPGADGRQGYRKKMKRAPEDVIDVRVFDDPIISKDQLARVQEIIESNRQRCVRARTAYPSRYTYNGHLTCSDCGELLYTHRSQQEFYVCKSKNPRERR